MHILVIQCQIYHDKFFNKGFWSTSDCWFIKFKAIKDKDLDEFQKFYLSENSQKYNGLKLYTFLSFH